MNRSKIFIFEGDVCLYISEPKFNFETGVYTGSVINGAWKMGYDTRKEVLYCFKNEKVVYETEIKLLWAGDNLVSRHETYNDVIENALERYRSGEKPNYNIITLIDEMDFVRDIPY